MINIEVFGVCNMKGALFVVDSFKGIVDMVVHCSYSVETFFWGGGGEFVVVI